MPPPRRQRAIASALVRTASFAICATLLLRLAVVCCSRTPHPIKVGVLHHSVHDERMYADANRRVPWGGVTPRVLLCE